MIHSILKKDLPASLIVFLVALPLSLGIALASGAPIMAGIIAATVGGIVVGFLGGAPMQVSGPAAGLTVIVYGLVHQFGWQVTCIITVLAGLIQIGLGFAKIARGALAISPAVVHGMLAGIGITIALAQLHVVLGGTSQSTPLLNIKALPTQVSTLHGPATMLGLLAIGILFAWPKLPKVFRSVPGPLAAVLIPTIASIALQLDVKRIDLPENVLSGIQLISIPNGTQWGPVITSALTVAVIASVESLLSAVAIDKIKPGKPANMDRELIGQGAGNAISGILGGLPITGVIVRSSANVNAGAESRMSAVLHGVWMASFALLFASVMEQIPLCVLAGLLVHVGIRLVDPHHIKELAHHRELPVYVATVVGVVFLGLLSGVGIGIALGIFMLLRRMGSAHVTVKSTSLGSQVTVDGSLTFLVVPKLSEALQSIPAGQDVVVELHADFMDHAAFDALHGWERSHLKTGAAVTIQEHHEDWYSTAQKENPRRRKSRLSETEQPQLATVGAE